MAAVAPANGAAPPTVVAGGTRRGWEIGAAIALLLLAGVAIWESVRVGAGYTFAGPESGFFPFWVAVPLAAAATVSLWRGVHLPGRARVFASFDELAELFQVGIPLAVAVVSIAWLGFYLATAAYVGFFAAWYGRYRWWLVLAAALLSPLVFYAVFERAFTLSLPKSVFYSPQVPF